MPCYYCRHFNEKERPRVEGESIIDSVRNTLGACTLSPTWETVSGLHYCSQLSPTEASLMGSFWVQMHEGGEDRRSERERRIAAEKKLKELSRKVKS